MLRIISASTAISTEKKGQRKHIPLMSETGKLVTADEQKAEVVSNYFASVFTGNLSSHTSRVEGLLIRKTGTNF